MDYARLAELERLMDQVSQHSARALRTSGDSQLNEPSISRCTTRRGQSPNLRPRPTGLRTLIASATLAHRP